MVKAVMILVKKLDNKFQFTLDKDIRGCIHADEVVLLTTYDYEDFEFEVKISKKGQITIPSKLRRILELHGGDVIKITFNKAACTLDLKKINKLPRYYSGENKELVGIVYLELVFEITALNTDIIKISEDYRVYITFYQMLYYIMRDGSTDEKIGNIISIIATDTFEVESKDLILQILSCGIKNKYKEGSILKTLIKNAGLTKYSNWYS